MSENSGESRGFDVDVESFDNGNSLAGAIVNSLPTDDELKIANCIVRIIMSRETRGLFIKRENFSEAYSIYPSIKRVKIELMFVIVQGILKNVYGLQLVGIPDKVVKSKSSKRRATSSGSSTQSAPQDLQNQTQNQTQASQAQNTTLGNERTDANANSKTYALISCLSPTSRSVLGELWSKSVEEKVANGRTEDDQMFFVPKYKRTDVPVSNISLIKNGILITIVSLIVLSENRISGAELFRHLKKFGLSSSVNEKNTSLNGTTIDIIHEFVKKEYLNREVDTSAENGASEDSNLVSYTLGRRLLAEFSPQAIYDMITSVHAHDFNEDLQSKTLNSIERAFGSEAKTGIKVARNVPDE